MHVRKEPSETERGRRTVAAGVLVFRWAALAWMVVLLISSPVRFAHPTVAWSALAVVLAWTVFLTFSRETERTPIRWLDLALAFSLTVLAGYVVPARAVLGEIPFFATAYPVASIIVWGLARGPWGGLAAAAVLGAGMILSRPINGVPLDELRAGEVLGMASTIAIFVMTGLSVGVVARLLERSAEEVRRATEAEMAAREEAGRLAERDSLARRIHDSVLQSLALMHKLGRELGRREQVRGEDARRLAEMAGEQERALRMLVARGAEMPPAGMASLRSGVETLIREIDGVPVEVSAAGPVWMPAGTADEVLAAVRQALENVVRHAGATQVTVHLDRDGGELVVSIRDDGRGFDYDEDALRREGKLGLVVSMRGRIEDLGGDMRVATAPNAGTEIEFRVPAGGAG